MTYTAIFKHLEEEQLKELENFCNKNNISLPVWKQERCKGQFSWVDKEKFQAMARLYEKGNLSCDEMCNEFGIAKSTFYKHLKEYREALQSESEFSGEFDFSNEFNFSSDLDFSENSLDEFTP